MIRRPARDAASGKVQMEVRVPQPLLLSLDISKSNTGAALGRVGEVPTAHSIAGAALDDVGAVMKLGHWLIDMIKLSRPDYIFFEAPLEAGAFQPKIDWEEKTWKSGRDPHTTVILAKLVGVVEFIAGMKSIPARPVNVRTARVTFLGTGSGNLKGDEAKARVAEMCKLLGWPSDNNDVTDAMCVWQHGCTLVRPHDAAVITPMMCAKAATLAAEEMERRKARSSTRGVRRSVPSRGRAR